jgi:hypothetical protein
MTIEKIHEAVMYGDIIRLRGCQLWWGKDDNGWYLDLHMPSTGSLHPGQAERIDASYPD